MTKVAKFGGSSLADANQIRKVMDIIRSDESRRIIVVSAPGKRHPQDKKITDLLYTWWHQQQQQLHVPIEGIRNEILARYAEIVSKLNIKFDVAAELAKIDQSITHGASVDYAASQGEYLCAKILALALGYEFIDAVQCIHFDEQGRYKQDDERIRRFVDGKKVVIPGFYGSMPDGSIKTFSRGGSDLTGAIVARAVSAAVYENWTDVSGLLMADPRVVKNPRKIKNVTHRELRELSYMGASVFHEEAMFPVQKAGIRTNICNTNDPNDQGTFIVSADPDRDPKNIIVGVAGRKNFTVITLEKENMNAEIGFAIRILRVLEANEISFEHMPSGIDTLSVIIDDKFLTSGTLDKVMAEIKTLCSPETIEATRDLALIATVGQGMVHSPGVAKTLFDAVAKAGVNISIINQGSSEMNIIIGVKNDDFEKTVRAIYEAFVH